MFNLLPLKRMGSKVRSKSRRVSSIFFEILSDRDRLDVKIRIYIYIQQIQQRELISKSSKSFEKQSCRRNILYSIGLVDVLLSVLVSRRRNGNKVFRQFCNVAQTPRLDIRNRNQLEIFSTYFCVLTVAVLFLLQSNKPIMEKRRRARINNCLNDLKTLILDAMKKDVSNNDFQRVTRNFFQISRSSISSLFSKRVTTNFKLESAKRTRTNSRQHIVTPFLFSKLFHSQNLCQLFITLT